MPHYMISRLLVERLGETRQKQQSEEEQRGCFSSCSDPYALSRYDNLRVASVAAVLASASTLMQSLAPQIAVASKSAVFAHYQHTSSSSSSSSSTASSFLAPEQLLNPLQEEQKRVRTRFRLVADEESSDSGDGGNLANQQEEDERSENAAAGRSQVTRNSDGGGPAIGLALLDILTEFAPTLKFTPAITVAVSPPSWVAPDPTDTRPLMSESLTYLGRRCIFLESLRIVRPIDDTSAATLWYSSSGSSSWSSSSSGVVAEALRSFITSSSGSASHFSGLNHHHNRLRHIDVSIFCTGPLIELIAQSCPVLEILEARCPFDIRSITDQCILVLANGCRRLRHLDISQSSLVTDASLEMVAQHSRERLEVLLIAGTQVGDRTLNMLGQRCPRLRVLDCGRCYIDTRVSDEGVIALAHGCPLLEALDVSCNTGVTAKGLRALAHCQQQGATEEEEEEKGKRSTSYLVWLGIQWTSIDRFRFSSSRDVNDAIINVRVLREIVEACPRLEYLHIDASMCSRNDLKALGAVRKGLKCCVEVMEPVD